MEFKTKKALCERKTLNVWSSYFSWFSRDIDPEPDPNQHSANSLDQDLGPRKGSTVSEGRSETLVTHGFLLQSFQLSQIRRGFFRPLALFVTLTNPQPRLSFSREQRESLPVHINTKILQRLRDISCLSSASFVFSSVCFVFYIPRFFRVLRVLTKPPSNAPLLGLCVCFSWA